MFIVFFYRKPSVVRVRHPGMDLRCRFWAASFVRWRRCSRQRTRRPTQPRLLQLGKMVQTKEEQFMWPAVHVIMSCLVSFSLIFFLYLFLVRSSYVTWGCNEPVRRQKEQKSEEKHVKEILCTVCMNCRTYSVKFGTRRLVLELCKFVTSGVVETKQFFLKYLLIEN